MKARNAITLTVLALVFTVQAWAKPEYLIAAVAHFPNISSTPLASCTLCHTIVPERNVYGRAYFDSGHDFSAIAAVDSDGDKVKNDAEIAALFFPGDPSSTPPTITVKKPNNGQIWVQGTKAPVSWTTTGDTGATVRIELLQNNVKVKTLKASAVNDGKQKVKVPSNVGTGSNFKVRVVSTSDPAVSDQSNKTFSIVAP